MTRIRPSANQAVVSLRWIFGLLRSMRGMVSPGSRVPARLSASAKTGV
jgi:hypothetical protein